MTSRNKQMEEGGKFNKEEAKKHSPGITLSPASWESCMHVLTAATKKEP